MVCGEREYIPLEGLIGLKEKEFNVQGLFIKSEMSLLG